MFKLYAAQNPINTTRNTSNNIDKNKFEIFVTIYEISQKLDGFYDVLT